VYHLDNTEQVYRFQPATNEVVPGDLVIHNTGMVQLWLVLAVWGQARDCWVEMMSLTTHRKVQNPIEVLMVATPTS